MVGVEKTSRGDGTSVRGNSHHNGAGMAMDNKVEIKPLSGAVVLKGVRPSVSGKGNQYLAAAIVSILAFMFGNSIGWSSPVQPLLESDSSPVGKLSAEDMSWLASLNFLGGMAGTFLWSRVADRFGRKVGGYAVACPFILGWGLMAICSDRSLFLLARFIIGIGGSGGLILAPTYISEIAQDIIRGALGSFVVLALNAGIVFAYILGALLPYVAFNCTVLTVPLLFVAAFYWLPESPEYLWTHGKKERAQAALLWLRGGDVECVEEHIYSMCNKSQQENVSYSALVCSKGRRMGMLIGFGLFCGQQLCGILAILSYTSFIFTKSGSSIAPERATVIIGVIQLFASLVSTVIVDRSGRRILLLVSYMFMGVALTSLGMFFYLDNINYDVSGLSWLPVASLSIHVVAYALGAGPVSYVVVSEVLPTDIRGLATSIIIFWGTLLAFVSVKIFPLLIMSVGTSGCFWFFSVFCYGGFLFTWCLIPETKGICQEDIVLRLNGGRRSDIL